MSGRERKSPASVIGRALLAYLLVFTPGATAAQFPRAKGCSGSPQNASIRPAVENQSSAAAGAKAEPKEAAGEAAEGAAAREKTSGNGAHEGIKVHGHWSIEVRNSDGRMVTHREIENSLYSGIGSIFLSSVLGRASTVGSYEIQLIGATINSGGTQSVVFIDEAGSLQAGAAGVACALAPTTDSCSTNLTVTAANGALTLAGSVVLPLGFGPSVNAVSTVVQTCNPTSTPQACPSTTSSLVTTGFTNRYLDGVNGDPQPVPVSPGQTVAVTVIISFT